MARAPSPMLIDYLTLRKLVGYIGLCLPFALIIGKAVLAPGPLPPSISDYYFSVMRDVLVGALCAIGVFLITYRGYDKDYLVIRITAFSAIGTAWFHTVPAHPVGLDNLVGIFHGVFAGLTFLSMSYISLFLFTRAGKEVNYKPIDLARPLKVGDRAVLYDGTDGVVIDAIPNSITVESLKPVMTRRKRQRNGVYRTCGVVMLADLALVPILTHVKAITPAHPMFWLETVAIEVFSISWLVKGQLVLKDQAK